VSNEQRTQGGLSVKTLLIAGAASATAALVIPMVWEPGTVFAAAMTPVVVALVSEMLRRPVDTVSAVRVRRTGRGTAILDPPPAPDEPFDPLAPPRDEDLASLPRTKEAPRAVHRRRPLTGRQWKIALVTGLVAFAAAAAVVTATELLAGDPISSAGGRTTLFSSGSKHKRDQPADDKKQQDKRDAKETATPTPTPSETPEEGATPTPTPTPTPTVTPAPTAQTAPAPAEPSPTP
jgi:hypothetical protein